MSQEEAKEGKKKGPKHKHEHKDKHKHEHKKHKHEHKEKKRLLSYSTIGLRLGIEEVEKDEKVEKEETVAVESDAKTVEKDASDVEKASDPNVEEEIKKTLDESESLRAECFVALNKVRGNALCLRASGAASHFYDSGSKSYYIKGKVCKEIIPKCARVFLSIAKLQKYVSLLINFRYALSKKVYKLKKVTDDFIGDKAV